MLDTARLYNLSNTFILRINYKLRLVDILFIFTKRLYPVPVKNFINISFRFNKKNKSKLTRKNCATWFTIQYTIYMYISAINLEAWFTYINIHYNNSSKIESDKWTSTKMKSYSRCHRSLGSSPNWSIRMNAYLRPWLCFSRQGRRHCQYKRKRAELPGDSIIGGSCSDLVCACSLFRSVL